MVQTPGRWCHRPFNPDALRGFRALSRLARFHRKVNFFRPAETRGEGQPQTLDRDPPSSLLRKLRDLSGARPGPLFRPQLSNVTPRSQPLTCFCRVDIAAALAQPNSSHPSLHASRGGAVGHSLAVSIIKTKSSIGVFTKTIKLSTITSYGGRRRPSLKTSVCCPAVLAAVH